MLQEFINLIERYEPGYSQEIRGASPAEIQHLEHLAGHSLPECYQEFLRLMGKDMGSLQVEGVDFRISRIIDFYEKGAWAPPTGYLLFGIQGEDPCLDYYLECPIAGAKDCPIVRFPSEGEFSKEEYFYPTDPSLKDFLLSLAFSEKRMVAFELERVLTPSTTQDKNSGLVSAPADIARLIDERARQLGFEQVAPASTIYRFYDSTGAAIYLRFDETEGSLGMTLATSRRQDLEHFSDILCNGTSLAAA